MFKPLLAAALPQSPSNRGDTRLGFVKAGFRRPAGVSYLDLRLGLRFGGDRAAALHSALRDACETITRMPAHYMTFPNGGPILLVRRTGRVVRPGEIRLDAAYLSGFGELRVPCHLWRALQRFDAWIEPTLIAEWTRLMRGYALSQGRSLEDGVIAQAMTWSEPGRDVRVARAQALRLLDAGPLHCVWTGRALSPATVNVDHCFPWAAWLCDDLRCPARDSTAPASPQSRRIGRPGS